jgi:archaellin
MITLQETLDQVHSILDAYREGMYSIQDLKDMRGELSVLLVYLGEYAGDEYIELNKAEYEVKKQEATAFLELRKSNTAADAERLARLQAEPFYMAEAEMKGNYKRLDNMFKALLKTLDSMASKVKEQNELL